MLKPDQPKNIKEFVAGEVKDLIHRQKQKDHREIVKEYAFNYVMCLNEHIYTDFFENIIEETDDRGCIASYIACKYSDPYNGIEQGDEAMHTYLWNAKDSHCAIDYLDDVVNAIKEWDETKHLSDHIDWIIERFEIFKQHTVAHEDDVNCGRLGCGGVSEPKDLWFYWGDIQSRVTGFIFPSLYEK